jgi:hypothetical protein
MRNERWYLQQEDPVKSGNMALLIHPVIAVAAPRADIP